MSRESDSGAVALLTLLRKLLGKSNPTAQSEREALAKFCQIYQDQRSFNGSNQSELFKQSFDVVLRALMWSCGTWSQQNTDLYTFLLPIFSSMLKLLFLLKEHRLTEGWWVSQGDHAHVALMALRLLLRDEHFQHLLMTGSDPLPALTTSLAILIERHFSSHQEFQYNTDLLKEITNIFQKISNCIEYRQRLVDGGVHHLLVQLLWSHDLVPLQCSLCALINLSKTDTVSLHVATLNCATPLLHIISSYDTISRHLASDLLLLLSQHSKLKEQIRDSDRLPQCLRILHSHDLHLLHRMVGVVERLAEFSDCQEDLRLLGGIPLLLGLLSKYVIDLSQQKASVEKMVALRAVCCSALTQFILNDANAQLVVQGNGVYLIAVDILPLQLQNERFQLDSRLQENLQRYALRTLRYLYSIDRNRKVFKKLFPPRLFEIFIDIGHYTQALSAYSQLMHTINTLPESERAVLISNVEAINQNKSPIFSIGGYAVLELLGSGAFGSVYKVRKQNSNAFLALKEIRCNHPGLGHTHSERSSSIGRILNEVNIIHEQLQHPNVVKYHKCFQEGDHLYIVMELLEGSPLSEHVSSLVERGLEFGEARLWKIFLQLVLALRYLHKEKHVVHRDLSPANLMISDDDKLTITDFGLAKQKQRELSVMKSVVGTVLYWCPELVQSEPYNEKADVWAAGCILYLMATLKPPFHSTNLLALARKIAEVDYMAIPQGKYSPLVSEVVSKCLTADPQLRPDTVQLGSLLSGVMMVHLDSLAHSNQSLERRLKKEKQKTVRHYHKAVSSERRYQQLISTGGTTTHAKRKLSLSFEELQSAGNATDIPGTTKVRSQGADATPPEDESNPLQNSSDSVFTNITLQERLLSNWEQPTSPQISMRGSGRLNSYTSRGHTHSSTEIPSQYQITRKSSLTALGAPHPLEWGAGPLSPLTPGHKSRTPSASSTLSISPKHLREITDPIVVLLTQLHKLVLLTQLPPQSRPSSRWTLLQLYKRQLFSETSTAADLKTQLHKLVHGSTETVMGMEEEPATPGTSRSRMVHCALQEMKEEGVAGDVSVETTLTYEILQQIIESLCVENGYSPATNTSTTTSFSS